MFFAKITKNVYFDVEYFEIKRDLRRNIRKKINLNKQIYELMLCFTTISGVGIPSIGKIITSRQKINTMNKLRPTEAYKYHHHQNRARRRRCIRRSDKIVNHSAIYGASSPAFEAPHIRILPAYTFYKRHVSDEQSSVMARSFVVGPPNVRNVRLFVDGEHYLANIARLRFALRCGTTRPRCAAIPQTDR